MSRPEHKLRAHVVLRPASPPQAVQSVVEHLEQAGFSVLRSSSLSVTIEGEPALFEEVFAARLEPLTLIEGGLGTQTAWRWQESPRLPEGLDELAAQVVLPHPVRSQSD